MALTVGLAGLGAIGLTIAKGLDAGVDELKLVSVAVSDRSRAKLLIAQFSSIPTLVSLPELADADVVVEALPAALFDKVAIPAIEAGKTFIPCSVGALLERWALVERARETGAKIVIPSGAIGGLDAVRAMARENISCAVLESRKSPAAFAGNAYVESKGVDVSMIKEPVMLFEGNAMDAARHFPANANVAAAVALAGAGPTKTKVEIWVDPAVTRNTHILRVEAPSARLTVVVENLPDAGNPKTSRLAPQSILACLQGLAGPLRVGS